MVLAVPLSRFTSQVGGGSAFFVRQHYTLMTTHTWILVGFAAVLAIIVAASYFGFRAQRTKMSAKVSRQLIWPFISQVVMSVFLALMFFDGMIRILFLAAIVGIYAPSFYWILKTPHDDHAA